MSEKTADEYLFDITCFLIASAAKCLETESKSASKYVASRLIQALYMLSFLPNYMPELSSTPLLMKVQEYVDQDPQKFWRESQLRAFIPELVTELSKELKKKI